MVQFEAQEDLLSEDTTVKAGRTQRDPLPEKFHPHSTDKAIVGPPKEQIQAAFNLLREVVILSDHCCYVIC